MHTTRRNPWRPPCPKHTTTPKTEGRAGFSAVDNLPSDTRERGCGQRVPCAGRKSGGAYSDGDRSVGVGSAGRSRRSCSHQTRPSTCSHRTRAKPRDCDDAGAGSRCCHCKRDSSKVRRCWVGFDSGGSCRHTDKSKPCGGDGGRRGNNAGTHEETGTHGRGRAAYPDGASASFPCDRANCCGGDVTTGSDTNTRTCSALLPPPPRLLERTVQCTCYSPCSAPAIQRTAHTLIN